MQQTVGAWAPSPRWANTTELAAKRALDVVGACSALLLLAPVLAAAAALVWLTSPGPILFRQERVGKEGRPFRMYKFRSMVAGADPATHQAYYRDLLEGRAAATNGTYKLTNDRRLTAVGGFLRRYSLDELPQLVNVLRGDMSLVGPRPPLPYEVEMYSQRMLLRLSVMPGMTGLWQVSGRNQLDFHQTIERDLAYVAGWSFWLDLRIIARTPRALVTGRGAS